MVAFTSELGIPQILVKFCCWAIVKLVALATNILALDNSDLYVCMIEKGSDRFPVQPYCKKCAIKILWSTLCKSFLRVYNDIYKHTDRMYRTVRSAKSPGCVLVMLLNALTIGSSFWTAIQTSKRYSNDMKQIIELLNTSNKPTPCQRFHLPESGTFQRPNTTARDTETSRIMNRTGKRKQLWIDSKQRLDLSNQAAKVPIIKINMI